MSTTFESDWENTRLKERIEELEKERDQLREQVTLLRDLLAWVDKYVGCAISGSIKEALAATEELK